VKKSLNLFKNKPMKQILLITSVILSNFISAQNFTLPKLSYAYTALEPTIDSVTMRIHHSKHHQAYVTNLNKALGASNTKSLNELLNNVSTQPLVVRNNAGGHYNHTLFWELLSATPSKNPNQQLISQINKQFGSLDSLQKVITAAGTSLFGSGWVWLILTPSEELKITTTMNQDNPLMDVVSERGIPLLAIDVWEHAYYLKYQNKRADYLKNIWNILDWRVVSDNYLRALKK
jgi:Fe-Mn family superoxide dismutase